MKILPLLLFLLFMPSLRAQFIGLDFDTSDPSNPSPINTGKALLRVMYDKYKQGPCKSYTFFQKNTHYRNDSVTGHSEWYEAIEFPDKFRIDFSDTTKGNFVIFKNDSSYRYKNFELKRTSYDPNILLLLLGGMYYREFSDVLSRLQTGGYKTNVISEQKLGKEAVYVIGALKGDLSSNQIWVSKGNYRVMRIIEQMDPESLMDMSFDAYQKHCNGFVETKVTFKRNGKIEQAEEYFNIKAVNVFPAKVFNP